MPPRLWKFFCNRKNREILSWLGGGAVVVVAGIWAATVYFFPAHKPPELSHRDVQANCGGVAIGGNVSGTTAGTTTNSDCSTKPNTINIGIPPEQLAALVRQATDLSDGERESSTTRLEEAAAAYRDALRERTRERVPLGARHFLAQ